MKKRRNFSVIHGTKKKKKPGEVLLYVMLLTAVGLLVLQATYSFAREVLASVFVKTVISENTTLEQVISVNGVIVRNEQVVAAPITGTVQWFAAEGERVGVGTKIATITADNGTTQSVFAPVAGVIIRELDGLEGVLQAKSLRTLDLTQATKKAQKSHVVFENEGVRQGTMLFKVVDNYTWYLVTELAADEYLALSESGRSPLRINFSSPEEMKSSWSLLAEEADRVRIAFELKKEVAESFSQRFVTADIIVKRTTGLVLPAKALVLNGEETGVYVLDKSKVRYRQVDVIEATEDQVVVEGVPTGYSVITNPFLLREGQRL
jgi:putative membrane fusion protein